MLRSCFIVAVVSLLSIGITHLRDAQGEGVETSNVKKVAWVRTIDGWEPSSVLTMAPPPQGPPAVHPALVASLQLGVSLFALLALPTACRTVRKS